MISNQYEFTKNPSAIKSLEFLEAMGVKYNNYVRRLGVAKAKRRAIRTVNVLWSKITKHCGHTKIS